MNKYLYTLLLAFSSLFMAEAQQLFDLLLVTNDTDGVVLL